MHTFNLATEAGTRDTLNGPLLRDYLRSVSELRGWSDSDTFMAPYVGHPIEGSVFGFIQRQNDPKYTAVQWGDGREYWVSILRSMAWSAVWHTQWKIGPLSEASIGNVMLQAVTSGAVGSIAEAREVIRSSFNVAEYHPQATAAWDDAYARFQSLTHATS